MTSLREEERLNSVLILLSLLPPAPLPLSVLAFLPVFHMGFPVFLPPLFPVLSLSPSVAPCALSLSVCLSPLGESLSPEAHRTGSELWQSPCLWKRKTTLSHFLLFCLKLATGVAYLCGTEILEVGRRGVAVITSSPIISFRLINVKQFHHSARRLRSSAFTMESAPRAPRFFIPFRNDRYRI